jgi:hypothetical protein
MKGVKNLDGTTAEHTRLITDSYRAANRLLHEVGFGKGGYQWSPAALGLIMLTRSSRCFPIQSVLDYGCGQGTLHWVLVDLLQQHGLIGQLEIHGYEPCSTNALLTALPEPADLVMCTDVLEHIEPEKLDAVMKHLVGLIKMWGIFSIAMHLSGKLLPDGTNSHRIVQNGYWWRETLEKYFTHHDILEIPINKPGEHYVVMISVKQDHIQKKMMPLKVIEYQPGKQLGGIELHPRD